MKKLEMLILSGLALGLVFSCNPIQKTESGTPILIRINQIGYAPGDAKTAIVVGEAEDFVILNAGSNEMVFQSRLGPEQYWEASGERVRIADFSSLQQIGTYKIQIGSQTSPSFEIKPDVYKALGEASIKAFYFHRAGAALEETYAGDYARPAGHPDTTVYIHASAASETRPEGSIISSPKGWYDAGDYNKYIVNSAISVATMMSAFEHFPGLLGNLDLNIPESADGVPDILDEIRWNLEWMLSMQDPEDGGVYHKLTSKNFNGMEMPDLDSADRYVVMKTTTAALDLCAAMAQASRVYQPYDPEFSEQCLSAAQRAWAWATDYPNIAYIQPSDIQTGEYGQRGSSFEDEWFWAAAELSITRGEVLEATVPYPLAVPEWRDGAALACMNVLFHGKNDVVHESFMILADSLLKEQQSSPYGVSNDSFRWGSNSDFLNQAMVLFFAYRLTGKDAYLHAAQSNYDWVLGKNPTGYSFVTGFGHKTPMHIHHRPSEGDDILSPQPGWLAGGPNPGNKEDCGEALYDSPYPAKSYLDLLCSYATNEIAINWNAILVYSTFALLSK